MISTLIAIATTFSLLFFSTPPSKSSYHSLYISDSQSSNESIANHLYILTRRPHVAGTEANDETASYVLSTLSSYNIKSHVANYEVALTYPVSRSLTLKPTPTDSPIKFDLRQEIYEGDPYADVAKEVTPTFHGYAKSGTAAAPVVYANYGRVEDYDVLRCQFHGLMATQSSGPWMDKLQMLIGREGKMLQFTRSDIDYIFLTELEKYSRYVILGNHRDAWTFGAVDPNSGTAAMLEVANRMGKLQLKGWRPRRTIIFCSWDAEEYGLVGSTEWVEENRELLASRAVAYMNIDSAVAGVGFYASATPQLDELLIKATKQIQDPDNTSQSIYQSWIGSGVNPPIGRLGRGGSDYASFVQHVGVPATDMYFGEDYPVYHSLYDDFIWMKKFGDPMFHRHVAVTSIWGLVALQLADEEFLPFNYLFYADELQKSSEDLKNELSDKGIKLSPLFSSIRELRKAAIKINNEIKVLQDRKGWGSAWKNDQHKVRELNDRLMMAERAFIDREGLPERPWYKHLIYAPSKHNDYGSKSFPGIDDAIEKANSLNTKDSWQFVQHEVWRVSRVIKHASLVLRGELT